MNYCSVLLSLSLLLPSAPAVRAQEPDSTDIFFQHLELKEIVVTGLAGDTRLKETPGPVSVLSAADLSARASSNIIDALAQEPGMSAVTSGGGISKPVIRGLGYNRVVVVSDGIRQEGQQWGDEHGIEIDGADVHSAEILKGPASLLYGSDALAGVIIFHPAPPAMPGSVRGGLSTEYQTNNGLIAYSLNVGGNHGGWIWDARFSDKYAHAYRNRSDGVVPNSGFRERAGSVLAGRNARWGYTRLKASYFHLMPGMFEGTSTGYMPGLPFQQVRHYKVVSDNTLLAGSGQVKVLIGWQMNRRQEFEESPQVPGLDLRLNTVNYELRYSNSFDKGWKLSAGSAGMFQRSENLGDEYLIPAYRLFDAGLFATASKQLSGWTFSGGIRGDVRFLDSEALSGRFEAFRRQFKGISASLGAVRPVGKYFLVRANVARGFRAPNLSELGANGKHEGTFRYELGNHDLQSEYSLQGDIGVDFSSPYVSVQSAFFVSRIRNYIFAVRSGEWLEDDLPVYRFVSGTAFLRGGEVAIDIHPLHSLHIGSSFSCVFADEAGGDALPLIPAPRLFSEVKYEITHGDRLFSNAFVSVNLDWNLAQNRFYGRDNTETPTPAYLLLGAAAGTDIVVRGRKWASVQLMGTNLTDAVYQSHLSRLKYAGISNLGRNIVLKIRIPF